MRVIMKRFRNALIVIGIAVLLLLYMMPRKYTLPALSHAEIILRHPSSRPLDTVLTGAEEEAMYDAMAELTYYRNPFITYTIDHVSFLEVRIFDFSKGKYVFIYISFDEATERYTIAELKNRSVIPIIYNEEFIDRCIEWMHSRGLGI